MFPHPIANLTGDIHTGRMIEVDVEQATEWMWRADRSGYTGFDVEGWDACTWILHAMYEVSGRFPDMTWDDYRKRELKAGRAEPQMVGNVNLDELTTDSGMSSGRTKTPGGRWQRLRWMELFSRLGQAPDHQEIPPCWRWFPYKSWPLRISPPHVGSLDRHQYERLVGKLEAVTASDDAMCLCYYSALSCGSESPEGLVVKVAMGDLRDLYDFDRVSGSPSNIWPEDRSWLVWTDSDLNSTCVRGPWTLVAEVEADPEFETIRWP